jgi:hypothetical protein
LLAFVGARVLYRTKRVKKGSKRQRGADRSAALDCHEEGPSSLKLDVCLQKAQGLARLALPGGEGET